MIENIVAIVIMYLIIGSIVAVIGKPLLKYEYIKLVTHKQFTILALCLWWVVLLWVVLLGIRLLLEAAVSAFTRPYSTKYGKWGLFFRVLYTLLIVVGCCWLLISKLK